MTPSIRHRNRQVFVDLAPLIENALEVTELTADVASTGTALTVKDIDGFAVNKVLVIGELGTESCEVVKTHASTAPTGTTVTLVAGGVEFAHVAGTRVYLVEFDQVEISHAATITGNKSILATANVQADDRVQVYTDTTQTTGYYFARFKESIGSTFGGYSDPVPYGGYTDTTTGYAISYALRRNGMKGYDDEITQQYCFEELNDFLQTWQAKLKRWPEHFKANQDIGNIDAGTPTVTLPTDIYDTTSNQSIRGLRVGDGPNLNWYDPVEFEEWHAGELYTQVATQAVATDVTLTLDTGRDFADAGTLQFFVAGTLYAITYTSVNRSTGVFSGIPATGDGAITVTMPVDTYVYQGMAFGEPTDYTVRNGVIELRPIPSASYHNRNLYADYWRVATAVDSESDDLDITRFHAGKYWLAWKIRMQKRNDGMLDTNDGFYVQYKIRLNDAVRTAPKIMTHKSRPFRRWGVTD